MDEPLVICYGGKTMRVHNLDDYTCDQRRHIAERTDTYIRKGDLYSLFDYVWAPDEDKKTL